MGIFFKTKWMLYNNIEYKRLWLEPNNQLCPTVCNTWQLCLWANACRPASVFATPAWNLWCHAGCGPQPAVSSCLHSSASLAVPSWCNLYSGVLTTLDFNSPYRVKWTAAKHAKNSLSLKRKLVLYPDIILVK